MGLGDEIGACQFLQCALAQSSGGQNEESLMDPSLVFETALTARFSCD
jgi:hypothetical protein